MKQFLIWSYWLIRWPADQFHSPWRKLCVFASATFNPLYCQLFKGSSVGIMLRILRSFVDFTLFSQILGSRYPRHASRDFSWFLGLLDINQTNLKMKLNFSARIFFLYKFRRMATFCLRSRNLRSGCWKWRRFPELSLAESVRTTCRGFLSKYSNFTLEYSKRRIEIHHV